MNKIDGINANNLFVARVGSICEQHKYEPTEDPEVYQCSNCGMKTIITQITATLERPKS